MPEKPTYEELEKRVKELQEAESKRKAAEKALEESEARFHKIIDALPQFIAYNSKNLEYQFVNQTYQDKFNLPAAEIVGKPLPEVIGKSAFEKARPHVERALKGELVRYYEHFEYKHGEPNFIEGHLIPDFASDGTVVGYYAVLTDITPYLKMQETLNYKEETLREAQEIARMGVFIWDLRTDSLDWSSQMFAIAGLDPEDSHGSLASAIEEMIHPDDRQGVADQVAEMVQQRRTWPMEFRLVRPDGEVRWLRSGSRFTFDEDDKPVCCVGVLHDITEQKEAETALRASEIKYRNIFLSSPLGIFRSTLEGQFLEVNPALAEMLGYESPESVIKNIYSISEQIYLRPAKRSQIVREQMHSNSVRHYINHYKRRDGSEFIANLYLKTLYEEGRPVCLDGIVEDITERKQMEEALSESEKRYRSVVETLNDGVILQLSSGEIVTWNNAAEEIFGISKNGAIGKTSEGKDWPTIYEDGSKYEGKDHPSMRTLRTGKPCRNEIMGVYNPSGELHWISINTNPLFDNNADIPYAVVISFSDITDRKKAEEALLASQRRLLEAQQVARIGSWDMDARTGEGEWSDELYRLLGYEPGEKMATYNLFRQHVHPEDLSRFESNMTDLANESNNINETFKYITKSGEMRFAHSIGRVEYDECGKPIRAFGTFQDVTERKQAEETLLRQQRKISMDNKIATVFLTYTSDEMYARILDIILAELDSEFGYFGYIERNGDLVCPSMTRDIWSKCEIEDKSIVFPPDTWGGIWGRSLLNKETVIANESLQVPEGHIYLKNAMAVPIIYGDKLIGQFVVANKVHGYNANDQELLESVATRTAPILNTRLEFEWQREEQNELHKQLLQAQQMEAIGTLAGGIAHDFNNILSSVIGYTELSLDQVESGTNLHSNLSEVMVAGTRAKDLVKQILTMGRRDEQEKKPVPVVPLIKEALKMLRSTIPTSIDIREHVSTQQLVVYGDPTQIHQIVMNLATNAVHAMAEMEGTLEVGVEPVKFDPDEIRFLDMEPGHYVKIIVSDTGAGIPDEYRKKIFEPYFTTKKKEHGTGLGLSVVHGIVKSHGGHISVYSEPGNGTAFHVYLPLAESRSHDLATTGAEALPRGSERILIVDDELPIGEMHRQRLEKLGYRATVRTNSVEALQSFQASPYNFDLILTDMTMPQLTGDKLAQLVKKIRPEIPVILCTGFSERVKGHEQELEIDDVLMKPIDLKNLAEKIRKLLD